MNGVLVVDKPFGPTSHDVVARARRALGVSRIGHTGTLDPLATGVLPLVVGRATRLAQFLSGTDKEYVAGVRLGRATATYDAEERLVRDGAGRPALAAPAVCRSGVDEATVRRVLPEFSGTFLQAPPPFSAKKVAGTPAYELARRRREVAVRPVQVTVRAIELQRFEEGLATLRIVCGAGFYVRSLAHDLGQRLGCGAHLESLRRTRAGEFGLDGAVPLDTLEAQGPAAAAHLAPMAALLLSLPGVVVNERGARRAAHGNTLAEADLADLPPPAPDSGQDRVRVLDRAGTLLAIGERAPGGVLHPVVVLV